MYNAKECAVMIRKELKKAYPSIKFSVKTYYASKVDVSYIGTENPENIEKLLAKYEAGHFDGMEDIYNYDNAREDIPQVQYIFVNREYPNNDYMRMLVRGFMKRWDIKDNEATVKTNNSYYFNNEQKLCISFVDMNHNDSWRRYMQSIL